jgi:hypothetical protein
VCRSKHVEPSINFGITNSITKLRLVGISTESYCDARIDENQTSKLYYSFWYYTVKSLPTGVMVVLELIAPDDERKYRSKHVEQPRNNKLSYTVPSCWSFSCIISRCTET